MLPKKDGIVHSKTPPCSWRDCLRATARADQRRAAIDEILKRFAELELNIRLASEMESEAGQ
jgi:hypothetical protein